MKEQLLELYENALLLSEHIGHGNVAGGQLPALFPGKKINELSDDELILLTNAVITGVDSWCF